MIMMCLLLSLLFLSFPPTHGKKTCNGQGSLVAVPQTIYTCANAVVTETQYNTVLAQNTAAKNRAAAADQAQVQAAAAAARLNQVINVTNTTVTPVICTQTATAVTLCVCRHDWLGQNCTDQRPITCQLTSSNPFSACATSSMADNLYYDAGLESNHQLCNFFDVATAPSAPIAHPLTIKCKFIDTSQRTCNTTAINVDEISSASALASQRCVEDSFKYWYDNKKMGTETFVVSNDPVARVRLVFYDLITLDFVGPNVSTSILSGEQLLSSNIVVNLPKGLSFVRDVKLLGGRLPGEFQFTSYHTPLSGKPLTDKKRKGILWEVPALSIVYNAADYKEPQDTDDTGLILLVIGVVLFLVVGIGGSGFYYYSSMTKRKKVKSQ